MITEIQFRQNVYKPAIKQYGNASLYRVSMVHLQAAQILGQGSCVTGRTVIKAIPQPVSTVWLIAPKFMDNIRKINVAPLLL